MFNFIRSMFSSNYSENNERNNYEDNRDIVEERLYDEWERNNDYSYDNQDEDLWDIYNGADDYDNF